MTTMGLGKPAARWLRVFLGCEKLSELGCSAFRPMEAGLRALVAWQDTIGTRVEKTVIQRE